MDMIFRLLSDLHLEGRVPSDMDNFVSNVLEPLKTDSESILLTAGDIVSARTIPTLEEFLKIVSTRFKNIFYIPGNHEYYKGIVDHVHKEITEVCSLFDSVKFTHKESFKLEDGRYIHATTLWTDLNGSDFLAKEYASIRMNDYKLIKKNDKDLLSADDTIAFNSDMRDYLAKNVSEGDIVLTHHLPLYESVHKRYEGNRLNPAFANDLSALIRECKPSLWAHGHTHDATDYMFENTRVVCNPFGYRSEEGKNGFKRDLIIKV